MSCGAKLRRRGEDLECTEFHGPWDSKTHRSGDVYWSDGEIVRLQCTAVATYCAEELRCDSDQPCKNYHNATSARYGAILWNDEKRPQPAVMFMGMGMGHRYGSYEADAMMVAAATMQDAANRLEMVKP